MEQELYETIKLLGAYTFAIGSTGLIINKINKDIVNEKKAKRLGSSRLFSVSDELQIIEAIKHRYHGTPDFTRSEEKKIVTDPTSSINSNGYVLQFKVPLKKEREDSPSELELIVKHCPNPKKSFLEKVISLERDLTRENVYIGGQVQKYLADFANLKFIPTCLLASPKTGNVSYFIGDSIKFEGVIRSKTSEELERLAVTIANHSIQIAFQPTIDDYFIKPVLYNNNRPFESKIKSISKMFKEKTSKEKKTPIEDFLCAYGAIVGLYLDTRAGYLSHGDFCAPNILFTKEGEPRIIDFDAAEFQNFYFDLNRAFSSLGLRTTNNKEVYNRVKERVRKTLEDITDNIDTIKVSTMVPTNNKNEVRIGIGNPKDKKEFRTTTAYVEFDQDLRLALVIDSKIKALETRLEVEDHKALNEIKNYYLTRARNSLIELKEEKENLLEEKESLSPSLNILLGTYEKMLNEYNGKILNPKEYEKIENLYSPHNNLSKYFAKYRQPINAKKIATRIDSHAERIIESDFSATEEKSYRIMQASVATTSLFLGGLIGISLYNFPVKTILTELANSQIIWALPLTALSLYVANPSKRIKKHESAADTSDLSAGSFKEYIEARKRQMEYIKK